MADVVLSDVRKSFGPVEVIRGISLTIRDGEFVAFVGPSGCGKSTLLRMIAGPEDITSGTLTIGGVLANRLPPKMRGIAMVFQSYALYPHKTVRQNMAFALKVNGLSRPEIAKKVEEAARILQIEELLDRKPAQLSGGQRQRVAIGRAIVRDPKVFLFDEPLSNLDAGLRVSMRMEIARLHNELDVTMAYVTHDQVEAMTLADRIVVLDRGVARQIGSPLELYHHPADTFVASFLGSPKMNFLDVEATGAEGESAEVRAPGMAPVRVEGLKRPPAASGPLTLGVRPEHAQLDADGPLAGRVRVVERLGDETILDVMTEGGAGIVVRTDPAFAVAVGETVRIGLPADRLYLFDEGGRSLHVTPAH